MVVFFFLFPVAISFAVCRTVRAGAMFATFLVRRDRRVTRTITKTIKKLPRIVTRTKYRDRWPLYFRHTKSKLGLGVEAWSITM